MEESSIESKELVSWGNKPYGETNIGLRRKENQDAVLQIDQVVQGFRRKTFAVADGVGGKESGKVASQYVIKKISEYTKGGYVISTQTLFDIDKNIPSGATTLVLAQELGERNSFRIHSIGDSSAIIIDSEKQTVTEITKRDEAIRTDKNGKEKYVVTQVMGPEGGKHASLQNPNIVDISLKPNQALLLSTDGFTMYMDHNRIKNSDVLKEFSKNDNRVFVKKLIDMALKRDGHDNIAIVSIPYEKPT